MMTHFSTSLSSLSPYFKYCRYVFTLKNDLSLLFKFIQSFEGRNRADSEGSVVRKLQRNGNQGTQGCTGWGIEDCS